MTLPEGVQPVSPDEVLYRRVPKLRYDPNTKFALDAFLPIPGDIDGLSLSRGCMTPEDVASSGSEGKEFWVAQIAAAQITAAGMTVVPDAPDHAVLPDLRRDIYDSPEGKLRVQGLARQLTGMVTHVHGPFPGRTPRK